MKHLLAAIAILLLTALIAPQAAHAAAATTIDLTSAAVVAAGQKKSKVIPTTFTTVTAEQQIDIKGDVTKPTQIQFQGTQDWYYKTTASGAKIKVLADKGETVYIESGTTLSIFVQRVSSDGVVTGQIVGP